MKGWRLTLQCVRTSQQQRPRCSERHIATKSRCRHLVSGRRAQVDLLRLHSKDVPASCIVAGGLEVTHASAALCIDILIIIFDKQKTHKRNKQCPRQCCPHPRSPCGFYRPSLRARPPRQAELRGGGTCCTPAMGSRGLRRRPDACWKVQSGVQASSARFPPKVQKCAVFTLEISLELSPRASDRTAISPGGGCYSGSAERCAARFIRDSARFCPERPNFFRGGARPPVCVSTQR